MDATFSPTTQDSQRKVVFLPLIRDLFLTKRRSSLFASKSAMANDVRNKLRQRMQALKDKIDEAEDRVQNAKDQLKKLDGTSYQLESERNSKKSKIALGELQLKEKNDQLEKMQALLEELTEKSNRENELVKTLEVMEIDGDVKLNDLEKQAKSLIEMSEDKELQNREMALKLAKLERDLEKAKHREEGAQKKSQELHELIETARQSIAEIKEREGDAFDRGDVREEKMKFLSGLLRTKQEEADEFLRQASTLERERDKLLVDIDDFHGKVEEKYAEMEALEGLTDDY